VYLRDTVVGFCCILSGGQVYTLL